MVKYKNNTVLQDSLNLKYPPGIKWYYSFDTHR